MPIYLTTMARATLRLTKLQDGNEQGNADKMNGAMTKTKATTMSTWWGYGCYNAKNQVDG